MGPSNADAYDVTPWHEPGADADDYCPWCEEDQDLAGERHRHHLFVSRDGANARTGDELARVFIDDAAALTGNVVPTDLPDPEGWCEEPDDAESLQDFIGTAEGWLCDADLYVIWDDGYVIGRVETAEREEAI